MSAQDLEQRAHEVEWATRSLRELWEQSNKGWEAQGAVRQLESFIVAALRHQPAPVVDNAMAEWKPRNRTEAVALAKIALAHLGVVDAYIDNAIARMETDAARAQEVQL